jgi:hypothetical protein
LHDKLFQLSQLRFVSLVFLQIMNDLNPVGQLVRQILKHTLKVAHSLLKRRESSLIDARCLGRRVLIRVFQASDLGLETPDHLLKFGDLICQLGEII